MEGTTEITGITRMEATAVVIGTVDITTVAITRVAITPMTRPSLPVFPFRSLSPFPVSERFANTVSRSR